MTVHYSNTRWQCGIKQELFSPVWDDGFFSFPSHRGCPAVVALLSTLQADLGVAVGWVEPTSFFSLLPLLQELEGQPSGVAVLVERERCDSGRDLHFTLVPRLLSHDGVSVGVAGPVALWGKVLFKNMLLWLFLKFISQGSLSGFKIYFWNY